MGSLSIWHWLIVLAIVVLVFGTGKLKNMGKDLGDATDDKKPAADAKAAVASDAAKPAAAKEEKAPEEKKQA